MTHSRVLSLHQALQKPHKQAQQDRAGICAEKAGIQINLLGWLRLPAGLAVSQLLI